MTRIKLLVVTLLSVFILYSCSKKSHPTTRSGEGVSKDSSSVVVKKAPVKKAVVPKVIVVNDKAAKKSVDGRYYYDLNGHRYWRNNKDGKYYLFNQSMYNDEAFKPVKN